MRFFMFDPNQNLFVDHSEVALPEPIRNLGLPGMAVVCGDVNNDGLEDIVLTTNGQNFLLLNDSDCTFTSVGRSVGFTGEYLSASAAFIDYNLDGLLDLFVGNYAGSPNRLYRNEGIGNGGVPQFVDVAPVLGMDYAEGNGSNWALGVAVADYDNDGDPDLYVANDYNGPGDGFLNVGNNILYRNNGDGTFTDVSEASGADDPGWAMGVAFGDYNGDGWLDIFLANFWEDALLQSNGDGTFTNVTVETGLITNQPGEWHYNGWGSAFVDYDNDGDLDIQVNNGYIFNDQGQVPNEPNQLWENIGIQGGYVRFQEVGEEAGLSDPGDARGAAYGDFNRDGFMDFFLVNNPFLEDTAPAPAYALFVNQGNATFREMGLGYGVRGEYPDADPVPPRRDLSGNNWVQVQALNDHGSMAVGARVTVRADGKTWIRDVGASSYCSQNAPFMHFGLGGAETIDEISVHYPDGSTVTETDLPARDFYTFDPQGQVPVKLLAFEVASTDEGARLSWRYRDDGDLAWFDVVRTIEGESERIAQHLVTSAGEGTYLDGSAPSGVTVEYALDAIYRDGTRERVGTRSFRYEPPARLVLRQNHPNPFTAGTAIPVFASQAGAVRIEVFDVTGRRIRTLAGDLGQGVGVLSWDGLDEAGRAAPAGTYFYRLVGTDHVRKMIRMP
jgi:hypothetical protein